MKPPEKLSAAPAIDLDPLPLSAGEGGDSPVASEFDLPNESRPSPGPRWDSLENRWTVLAILAVIIAGGLLLRSYGLYGRSIWFDESASWRMTQFPFGEMVGRTARDNHLPLFFLLLRLWKSLFGEGLIALRSFNLAASGLAMLGVYLFTVEAMRLGRGRADSPQPLLLSQRKRGECPMPPPLSGNTKAGCPQRLSRTDMGDWTRARWIGLVATALFAASLYQIRLAWDIRMYTVGAALAMFSSWLLVRALDARPPRALPWMLYMLVALAFAYTHYCALFTLFAQALFALAYLLYGVREDVTAVLKEPNFRWFTLAYVGVAAGWAPWLPIFLAQRERVADSWYTAPFSLQDVPAMCYEMFFHTGSQGGAWSHALIVAGLCAFVLLALLWKGGAGQWCTALLAVVPFALISLVSYASSNLMIVRYMAFLQPFILIALAAVLWRIAIGALREVVAYIVVSAALLLHVDFVDSLQIANRPGARAAAAYIDARRAPGEPAIACSPLLMFPTKFHSCNREGWHVYSDRREIPYYAGGSLITDGDIFYEADMDAVRAKRAWVITTSGNWARWALYIPPKWVRTAEQRFEEVYSFQNDVVVICYFTE